jgi:hypothetical protein
MRVAQSGEIVFNNPDKPVGQPSVPPLRLGP